ncbi:hypothetical protein BX600DRAFT_468444 [Xylariales sp. PMI_506]|nr:hypothetical protein BX600DRAFT_468444 [Xylariales sp. PMI_506]
MIDSIINHRTLYTVAAGLFFISAPSHALLGRSLIIPGLAPLNNSDAAAAATNNWMVQSLYHVIASLTIHRWSLLPAEAWTVHDNAIFAVLVLMNWASASGYRGRPKMRRVLIMLMTRSSVLAAARAVQVFWP